MTAIEMREPESSATLDKDHGIPTLLVAVDGSETSIPALTAARLISEINDVDVRVVSVLEPISIPMTTPSALLDFRDADAARIKDLASRVALQVAEYESDKGAWCVENRLGSPAAEIVQSAREHAARVVIVGANRHGFVDRLIGEETATKIAQLGQISLLVAQRGM